MDRRLNRDLAPLGVQAGPPAAKKPHREPEGRRADPAAAGDHPAGVAVLPVSPGRRGGAPRRAGAGCRRLEPVDAGAADVRGGDAGLPAEASQFLARSSEAARGGPGALFAFLLKQSDLPQAEVRSACLNLLPQIPDRLPQFEKSFGPLSKLERHRIQALAAEARGDWEAAEQSWRANVPAIADTGDRPRGQAVARRHLPPSGAPGGQAPEIEGDGDEFLDDPVSLVPGTELRGRSGTHSDRAGADRALSRRIPG